MASYFTFLIYNLFLIITYYDDVCQSQSVIEANYIWSDNLKT